MQKHPRVINDLVEVSDELINWRTWMRKALQEQDRTVRYYLARGAVPMKGGDGTIFGIVPCLGYGLSKRKGAYGFQEFNVDKFTTSICEDLVLACSPSSSFFIDFPEEDQHATKGGDAYLMAFHVRPCSRDFLIGSRTSNAFKGLEADRIHHQLLKDTPLTGLSRDDLMRAAGIISCLSPRSHLLFEFSHLLPSSYPLCDMLGGAFFVTKQETIQDDDDDDNDESNDLVKITLTKDETASHIVYICDDQLRVSLSPPFPEEGDCRSCKSARVEA
jgi:hypothetical protein